MNRRHFFGRALATLAGAAGISRFAPVLAQGPSPAKIVKTNAEWKKLLTPAQYHVLREEGTEAPHSSPLNDEKRKGTFICAACELPLFDSRTKYHP